MSRATLRGAALQACQPRTLWLPLLVSLFHGRNRNTSLGPKYYFRARGRDLAAFLYSSKDPIALGPFKSGAP